MLWKTAEPRGHSAYCVRVTSPRLPLTALVAAAALASLTGCSPEPAVPPAPSAATAEPLFATDEEALAAAEAAFEEYLAVTNLVLQEGGVNPDRIRPLVSDKVWESDLEDAERWQNEGLRTVGATELESSTLQQTIRNSDGGVEVVSYNCLSNADVDVLNGAGESVVSDDRSAAYLIEAVVSFTAAGEWIVDDYRTVEEVAECE